MTSILMLETFRDQSAPIGPILPRFGGPEADIPPPKPEAAEEEGLSQAYDLGYQTGWAARDLELHEAQAAMARDFHEALHALSFTWEEAHTHVLTSLVPLFRSLIDKVLPELASRTWGDHIVQELARAARLASEAPVTLLLNPSSHDALAPFLEQASLHPFRLVADEQLGPHQAAFRLGASETLYDLEGVLTTIRELVEANLSEITKAVANG